MTETGFYIFIAILIVLGFVAIVWIYISDQNKKHDPYRSPFYDAEMRLFAGQIYDPSFEETEEMTEDDWQSFNEWEAEQEEREAIRQSLVQQELERRRRIEAEREQERREIEQAFPAWLVTFGEDFGITGFKRLAQLSQYIGAIILYGQQHLDGTLPIKRCYNQANDDGFGITPPDAVCYGRTFFERLSKVLVKNGLLENGRGAKGRFIAADALMKFRPVSSVQHPSGLYAKNRDSHDFENFKPDETD